MGDREVAIRDTREKRTGGLSKKRKDGVKTGNDRMLGMQ